MRFWNVGMAVFTGSVALLAAPALHAAQRADQTAAAAQNDRAFAADFRRFLTGAMARFPSVPAMSVAIVHNGHPVVVDAAGFADVARRVPATPDTRFYIASSTKSFVGTAMALLAERGTIDLDWTLAQLAPDIHFASDVHADRVTLRDLLTHTHGLRDDPLTFRLAYSGDYDRATLWRLLADIRPNTKAPLGTFSYSNLGYNVATLLVERRLGKRWQDIVRDDILKPLNMRETLTQGLAAARADAPFALPYDGRQPLYLVKVDKTMHSAGGMYSTATDMARWLELQMSDRGPLARAAATARKPVATLDKHFGPFQRTGYGLGWYSGDYRGHTLYHAFGSFVGARAHVSLLPDQRLGVAAMSNDDGVGFFLVDIAATYAYDWYLDGPDAAAKRANAAMDKLKERAEQHDRHVAAARAERAARPSTLTLPPAAYAGRYCNSDYGDMLVTDSDGRLRFSMGRLHAIGTPGEQADAVRLELIPGNGQIFQFVTQSNRVQSIHAFGEKFDTCGKAKTTYGPTPKE